MTNLVFRARRRHVGLSSASPSTRESPQPSLTLGAMAVLLSLLTLATSAYGEERKATQIKVAIQAGELSEPMSEHIYSQFIEHLGRCIYGGIWAEMLEDRKFFFPITPRYAPYQKMTESPFPVVGASPWQMLGGPEAVLMEVNKPFVGEQTPRIRSSGGIAQHDLGLIQGKDYVGSIWLKAVAGRPRVLVSLDPADSAHKETSIAASATEEYRRHEFRFIASESTDRGTLSIRAIDGDVLVGTVSLMPADHVHGMRPDTLALLKELNAPLYRWPGGNFVSGYDWRDGIGDRDRRPPRKNPAWTGVEHNDFGIDEFVRFCREVGADPVVTVNTGFGDAYSAGQEVEYCNGSADTIGGSWRAQNGHPEPYGVRLWCVGNEMFGKWQLGYMDLSQYVLKHNDVVRYMRRVDPTIKLIGVGDLGDWSRGMLKDCAKQMDYISEHFYCGRTPWTNEETSGLVKHVRALRDEIRKKADGHRKLQDELKLLPDRKVPIAMDEWNYWHREYVYGELGCRYDLADAMGVAIGLHEYSRNTDIIASAFYAQTVNVIGCIKTTKTDAFLDATALPLILYRKHFGTIPVKVSHDGDAAGVDIAASWTTDRRGFTVAIVNPQSAAASLSLEFAGVKLAPDGVAWQIAGDDAARRNDETNKTQLKIVEQPARLTDALVVPPFSINVFQYRVDDPQGK